jgi:hypothetical protein
MRVVCSGISQAALLVRPLMHLQVVACELSPLLETLLSIEYPLWQLSTAALAGTVGSSATTGLASGPPTGAGAGGDNLGQEVVRSRILLVALIFRVAVCIAHCASAI